MPHDADVEDAVAGNTSRFAAFALAVGIIWTLVPYRPPDAEDEARPRSGRGHWPDSSAVAAVADLAAGCA